MANQRVLLSLTENNTFIVAARAEPYFCFEAATESEALDQAKSALAFWAHARKEARDQAVPSRQKSVTVLRPLRRVEDRELVPA